MPESPDVIVVGSVNLDTTLRVPHIPQAGETILSAPRTQAPGGKGANQAAAAAAVGAAVHFVAAVGDDGVAEVALANLTGFSVDLAHVQRHPAAPTGAATVIVSDDAENMIIVDPGANDRLDPHHVAEALRKVSSRVLLAQLEIPLDVVEVCAAHTGTRWRILNPAPMSPAPELRELLHGFNVLVPNRTELAQLAGRPEPVSFAEVRDCVAALGFGGTVVVTLGAEGAALFPEGGADPLLVAPPPVAPVNTTGAGDVFSGVLAHGLAGHGDLVEAVRAAVRASAASTKLPESQLSPEAAGTISAGAS